MTDQAQLDQIIRPSIGTRFWRALGYRLAPLMRFDENPLVADAITTTSSWELTWRDRLRLLVPGSRVEVRTVTRVSALGGAIDGQATIGILAPGTPT